MNAKWVHAVTLHTVRVCMYMEVHMYLIVILAYMPIYVSGSTNINDIHRITCHLRWVWLTLTG